MLRTGQILLAFVFLAAGSTKLAGVERLVDLFRQIGVGQWFRYATAALEIAGALALLNPATAFWGAVLIACIMVGAAFTHLALIGGSAAPSFILLALALLVAWGRRPAGLR